MELVGLKEGKQVKANAIEFAKDNALEGESYAGVGQSYAHARYMKRDGQGKATYREVDLREMASEAGITGIQFNFDAKAAKDAGLMLEDRVDSGVAYNLERLRSDDGKRKYLADKGHTGIFNDGDNYYSVKDGYIQAINNKDGEIDWSDVSRFGATIGSTIGSTAGVVASGVGALATGGSSLLIAGTAGAAGAVIGECAQRAVDTGLELAGAKEDTSKYQNATAAEEALSLGKTALGGAFEGSVGQLASRAMGAAKTGVMKGIAGIAQKVGSEETAAWTAKKAAQQEAGYLMGQLPTGKVLKTMSANEATAQRLLKETQNPEATTAMIQKANTEAKTLMSGRVKQVVQDPIQDAEQESLRTVARGHALKKEAERIDAENSKRLFDATKEKRKAEAQESFIARAKDTFGTTHAKEIDKIFSPHTDITEAEVAAKKVQDSFITRLNAKTGVKIEHSAEGALSIEEKSLHDYTTNKLHQGIQEAGEFADSMSLEGFRFNSVPTDQDKAAIVEATAACKNQIRHLADMRPEQYNIAMSVLSDVEKVINNHSPMTQKDTAEMLIEFMKKSREIAGDKSYLSTMQDAIINLNRQMFEYTRNISNAPLMLDRAHAAQIKALELSQVSREGFRDNVKSAEQIFGYLSDLGIVGGDESGTLASEVASMWHLYFKENGYTNMASKTFNRMNDIDRVRFSGFDAVRNHNNLVPKKAVPKKVAQKEPEEGLFAKALPAVVGIATMSATGSATMAAGASAATAAVVSKKARTKVTEKTASSLKNVGKVLASRPGKIAVGQRMATGAEEYMSDKLQNFTKRGHNRED